MAGGDWSDGRSPRGINLSQEGKLEDLNCVKKPLVRSLALRSCAQIDQRGQPETRRQFLGLAWSEQAERAAPKQPSAREPAPRHKGKTTQISKVDQSHVYPTQEPPWTTRRHHTSGCDNRGSVRIPSQRLPHHPHADVPIPCGLRYMRFRSRSGDLRHLAGYKWGPAPSCWMQDRSRGACRLGGGFVAC
jgi:hypothetical protein